MLTMIRCHAIFRATLITLADAITCFAMLFRCRHIRARQDAAIDIIAAASILPLMRYAIEGFYDACCHYDIDATIFRRYG